MTRPRKPKKHAGGRPPLAPGEARTERVHVLLLPRERAVYEAHAARAGVHLAEWIRRACDQAAGA